MSDTQARDVAEAAKDGEPDRYLAALLAAPQQRSALLALAAFSAELARIPQRVVHEPAMGEIRLQWWRDTLALPASERTGHPVADAIREAAHHHALSRGRLEALIDGRLLLLEPSLPGGEDGLRDLLWKTEGALFALGLQVAGLASSPEIEAGCTACGQAYGLARLLQSLPLTLASGRVPIPAAQLEAAGLTSEGLLSGTQQPGIRALIDTYAAQIHGSLTSARRFAAELPRSAWPVFLPLALVGPYVRGVERAGGELLRNQIRISPLGRVSRIAAAHLLGRF